MHNELPKAKPIMNYELVIVNYELRITFIIFSTTCCGRMLFMQG